MCRLCGCYTERRACHLERPCRGTPSAPQIRRGQQSFFAGHVHPDPRTPIPLEFPPYSAGYLAERLLAEDPPDRGQAAQPPMAQRPPAADAGREVAAQAEQQAADEDELAAEELWGSDLYEL